MHLIDSVFDDFEEYSLVASEWELDFRLLSKNDFRASLKMASFPSLVISRTRLYGKIEQIGLTPSGYRSIAIPIHNNRGLIWLNKLIEEETILVFPEDRTLDAVSHHLFDVYVLSIKEAYLYSLIDSLECDKSLKYFKGDEQHILVDDVFITEFGIKAEGFLSAVGLNTLQYENKIHDLLSMLLLAMNHGPRSHFVMNPKRRDIALKKAIEIINDEEEGLPSIPQLCQRVELSERSLQYAFQNKYQVTPIQYMKALRLHKVKRKLHAMKGENIRISDIAGEYHFWHMGDFAKDFQRQFGILPSQMLNG